MKIGGGQGSLFIITTLRYKLISIYRFKKLMRLCKSEPPSESFSVELFWLHDLKIYWPHFLVCKQSQDRYLKESLKKNRVCFEIYPVKIH